MLMINQNYLNVSFLLIFNLPPSIELKHINYLKVETFKYLVNLLFNIKMSSNLDYPCKDYDEYEKVKKHLEANGYKFHRNYSADDSIYWTLIVPLLETTAYSADMAKTRREKQFETQVEEMEWYWKEGGYIVKKVQGFNIFKKPVEGLVAFFVKNALEDIIISDMDEEKPTSLPKPKSQEELEIDFFKKEEK